MFELESRGLSVPVLGFGTNRILGAACVDAVLDAIAIGYRYFDTAQRYGNEAEVGEGIERSGTPRDSVIVSTKLDLEQSADQVVASTKESLRKLRTDYVDILYIHWPNQRRPLSETVDGMLRLKEQGHVRAIGVSNFTVGLLNEVESYTPVFTNQFEYHPYLGQDALLDRCRLSGITVTAYAPLARGKIVRDPVIEAIAVAHGKSASQVALRWVIQHEGVGTIPKSASHQRRVENFEVFDFELAPDEMTAISALGVGAYRVIDPPYAPIWDEE